MKKILCFIITILIIAIPALAVEPELFSASAILIDGDSGQILYSKDALTKRAPASITKLMTALLVLENCQMDETITASRNAVFSIARGSTHIAIDTDEQMTVEQALNAMIIESANDAANVLAEHIGGGSLDDFAKMMTERAKELGCKNTNFANAHGLDDDNHYTCAYDMALIALELEKFPKFLDISSTILYTMPPTNKQKETRYFRTKQTMLKENTPEYSADVVGGKTGWTTNAKHTMVTFGERDNRKLIAVVLNSTNKSEKFTDTQALFDYGFDNFKKVRLTESELSKKILSLSSVKKNTVVDNLTDSVVYIPKDMNESDLIYTINENSQLDISYMNNEVSRTALSIPFELIEATSTTKVKDNQPETSSLKTVLIVIGVVLFILFLLTQRHKRIMRRKRRNRSNISRKYK